MSDAIGRAVERAWWASPQHYGSMRRIRRQAFEAGWKACLAEVVLEPPFWRPAWTAEPAVKIDSTLTPRGKVRYCRMCGNELPAPRSRKCPMCRPPKEDES